MIKHCTTVATMVRRFNYSSVKFFVLIFFISMSKSFSSAVTDGCKTNVSSLCLACAPGQFASYDSITNKMTCYPCDAGEYFNATTGKCTTCPLGFSCSKGSSIPIACGVGFYAPKKSSICHVCERGKYQPNSKQVKCLDCPMGKFEDNRGSLACKNCPADTFNKDVGLIAPEKCVKCIDFVQHTSTFGKTGQTSSVQCICKDGMYPEWSESKMLIKCKPCPLGGVCKVPNNVSEMYNVHNWMVPKNGFWKTPLDQNKAAGSDGVHNKNWENVPIDDIFVKCRTENVCTEDGCAEGHGSILCETCAENYGKQFGKCVECNDNVLIWATVALICILIIVTIMLYCIMRRMRKSFSRKLKAAWKEFVNVLKLNIDFLQISNSMPSVLAVEWPRVFLDWINLFQFVNIDFLQLGM